MTQTDAATGRAGIAETSPPWLFAARLGIGLFWGVCLWWLFRSAGGSAMRVWPANNPPLFGALLLACGYAPVVALAGVGRLRGRTYAAWMVVAVVILAGLGWHDLARQTAEHQQYPPYLSPPMLGFVAAALFIAHHLIAPADAERRWIASFPAYFDTAWKAGVQLALSLGFTAAFWLLLVLGSQLFRVIGLSFLQDLIGESWFDWPVSGVVFALAVHLTDVRDGLIRGVRSVALMLLSWLLLVITVLVAGFLVALPFTGMKGLWETGSATALVLAAAGALIVLINTAYQDGRPDNRPPAVLRIAVRVAAVLLTPLIVIAWWGLALRIGQHGLTPDRIIAQACAVVGTAYAIGYGAAALVPFARRGSAWMKALEMTNVLTAMLEVAVILALFSPLADPARLSVADQVRRLEAGKVAPADFDYRFLRFDSGRAGEEALARLARSPDTTTARLAGRAQKAANRYEVRAAAERRTPVIEAWPQGAALPAGFVTPVTESDPRYGCDRAEICVATETDLNGDGVDEVLMAGASTVALFARDQNGRWTVAGGYRPRHCRDSPKLEDPRDLLRRGLIKPSPSPWPDLSFDGAPAAREDRYRCPGTADDAVDVAMVSEPVFVQQTPADRPRQP